MKYLRRFNESSEYDWELEKEDFQDFCDTYLAYLIDDEFKIDLIDFEKPKKTFCFTKVGEKGGWIYNPDVRANDPFDWDEVKDTFIPFLSFLKKKYDDIYYIGGLATSSQIGDNYIPSNKNLILISHSLENGMLKYDYVILDKLLNDEVDFKEINSIQISLKNK